MKSILKSISLLSFSIIIVFSCTHDKSSSVEDITAVLHIVSGENQPGENGETLNDPVVVRATDVNDISLEGVDLYFTIVEGGGTLNPQNMQTDNEGLSEIEWTLGTAPDHILKVYVDDLMYTAEPVYVYAQTDLAIETKWISNINFPRLFDKNVAHDNRILESNHFLVFSDGSSDEAKIRFSKMAEETFYEIMQAFHIQSGEELGILNWDKTTKIKIFSNINTNFPYGAFAFNTGYVSYALDSQTYLQLPDLYKENYRRDVKHETMHLLQFLLGLDNLPNLWPDVWFSEGISVFISNNRIPPANIPELNEWRQVPGNENPIRVHDWHNLPIPENQGGRYYPMFGLAVKYLLHEKGHGKTYDDVLDMYKYMASSYLGFPDAFEKYMGMSLKYYEDNFFTLITDFLTRL